MKYSVDFRMNEKEERKRIRRERIRRRFDNSPQEVAQLSPVSESKSKKENSEIQVLESLAFLVKKKKDDLDTVTHFRVDSVQNETDRRLKEEEFRERRYQISEPNGKIDTNDEIERLQLSWESLLQIDKPLDLFGEMTSIKSSYNHVLDQKDTIISELKKQLIEKDEAYLDNLRKQSDITTQLQFSMDNSMLDLQTHYCNELKSIKDTLVDDRTLRIQSQLKMLNELVENKAKHIEYGLEELMRRREEKQNVLECSQDKTTQVYNDLKTNLYAQVNKLECELAISRAIYQANSDQIEYNQRSTAANNAESEEKIKKRKKRIALYKEELSKELDHSRASDVQEKRKNDILTQDCRRLEGQYNNLLSKLHRFEIVEGQKYSAAAAMHEEEINALSERISNSKVEVANDFTESVDLEMLPQNEDIRVPWSNHLSEHISTIEEKMYNDASSFHAWVQLDSMLLQYHELLENKERRLGNVSNLDKENSILQQKLDRLLEEDINNSLIVPPLHT